MPQVFRWSNSFEGINKEQDSRYLKALEVQTLGELAVDVKVDAIIFFKKKKKMFTMSYDASQFLKPQKHLTESVKDMRFERTKKKKVSALRKGL